MIPVRYHIKTIRGISPKGYTQSSSHKIIISINWPAACPLIGGQPLGYNLDRYTIDERRARGLTHCTVRKVSPNSIILKSNNRWQPIVCQLFISSNKLLQIKSLSSLTISLNALAEAASAHPTARQAVGS